MCEREIPQSHTYRQTAKMLHPPSKLTLGIQMSLACIDFPHWGTQTTLRAAATLFSHDFPFSKIREIENPIITTFGQGTVQLRSRLNISFPFLPSRPQL